MSSPMRSSQYSINRDVLIVLLFGTVIRIPVTWFGYSGEGIKPMHGDYEAQRHWMEITWNLPIREWYANSTDNDLMYWGLDYPPLTAYHSLICGAIASKINGSWVELHSSRGLESPQHKQFMRATVLLAELLVLVPALILNLSHKSKAWVPDFLVAISYPGLILIDHGHFQYNSVSLGFALLSVAALLRHKDLLASFLFCLSLCYKQMELYHAPVFFFFLLGRARQKGHVAGLFHVCKLGATVFSTIGAVCAPFLTSSSRTMQLFTRVFPFNRGLFEDKVASFWCSLAILVKIQQKLEQSQLVKLCAVTVLLGLVPTAVCLVRKPSAHQLRLAMVTSALVFFLFSYHVHEKSILLAAVPCCLLIQKDPVFVTWFLSITSLSMTPLLVKDGQVIPAHAITVIFLCASFICHSEKLKSTAFISKMSMAMSIAITWALCICQLTVTPPSRYPDLWPVLIAASCCVQFGFTLLILTWWQLSDANVICFSKAKKS